jgi:hypothetical protein
MARKDAAHSQELAGHVTAAGSAATGQHGLTRGLSEHERKAAMDALGMDAEQFDLAMSGEGAGHPLGLTVAAPGGLSNWMKMVMLDYAFGGTAPAAASANVFVGLGTGTFTGGTTDIGYLQNGITNEVTTTNWTNYARVTVANNSTNLTAATGVAGTQVATKTNGTAITFAGDNAAVTGTGPTPTWFFIMKANTNLATDIICVGVLTSGNTAVVNGNAVHFSASALTITIT